MKLGLVSVVIPTFNQEEFIYDTVKSVIEQSYSQLEIIVADDCSKDKTVDIVRELMKEDRRIQILTSEKNLGIPGNFNRAFDACSGEYVAFLGGDDLMKPEKIHKQLKVLNADESCGLVLSDMEYIDQGGRIIGKLSDDGVIPDHPLNWALKVDWFFDLKQAGVIPSSTLARSKYYLSTRYSDQLLLKHELLFTAEAFCNFPDLKWRLIPECLGQYRIHSGNFSRNDTSQKNILTESFKLAELIKDRCPSIAYRAKEYEYFTAYKARLFNQYRNKEEKKVALNILKDHTNVQKRIWIEIGRLMSKIGLLGLYIRLNRTLKVIP